MELAAFLSRATIPPRPQPGAAMLRYLSIEHLAVIDKVEIEFEPGLNVLTGETGAGKSILVEAVGLLLGDRASGDLVSDLGLFPDGDPDLLLLPVGFPSICPAPGLAASIYGYLPVFSGGVLVRPPTP